MRTKRVNHQTASGAIQGIAAEIAWIRSAGFTSASRVERLLSTFARLASAAQESPVEVLAALQSRAALIQEESRRRELAEFASKERKRIA